MDVVKYIYVPSPHGNYSIVKVLMEPKLDPNTNEILFRIKDVYRLSRIRGVPAAGFKPVYKNDECFDFQGDAAIYAEVVNVKHVERLKKIINAKIQREQAKLDKLSIVKPKIRNMNLVK